MDSAISTGRLLRANTRGCVVGCRVGETPPAFGSLVYIPTESGRIYGLVSDVHIDDDGLVRQLAAVGTLPETIIQDNRVNRNIPLELSVIFIGRERQGKISHLLPLRPPLSLDEMIVCDDAMVYAFTSAGRFGYLRHILGEENAPIGDLLTAFLQTADKANRANGNPDWIKTAVQEIIILLRGDHERLTLVLSAVSDAFPDSFE